MSDTPVDRRLDTLERFRADMTGEVKKIRKVLYGNGEPGWDEMLRELWADLQERKAAEHEAVKEAKRQDKEIKLGTMRISAELKMALINGAFVLFGILLTWWLHR